MTTLNPLFIIAVWGPTIAALIVTMAGSGKGATLHLLKKFIPPRCSPIWYLTAILSIPVIGATYNLVTGKRIALSDTTFNEFLLLLLPVLITGPLGEEFGWRGFAVSLEKPD